MARRLMLRGQCGSCGKYGCVRENGFMFSHICLRGLRNGVRLPSEVFTFERRVENFVRAILPAADEDRIKRECERVAAVFKEAKS